MKFNVRVFFHGNLQSIRRFGQEHVSAFFVFGQIQSLSGFKIFQLFIILTGDPGGFIQ